MAKAIGQVSAKLIAEKTRERQRLTNIIPVVLGTVGFPVPLFICPCPFQGKDGTLCPSPSCPMWEVGVIFFVSVCLF